HFPLEQPREVVVDPRCRLRKGPFGLDRAVRSERVSAAGERALARRKRRGARGRFHGLANSRSTSLSKRAAAPERRQSSTTPSDAARRLDLRSPRSLLSSTIRLFPLREWPN